eukprot:gnl/MRDRNA2_/MRDRNA2_50062_c0_seq1.p1 gnl/MRDRNA2_/MRDRNA2_50062_c0~~gnl/MRDRNA2_/MRDRNA2_50062_c0_seq1.p1  ORF type:complete len:595 (+),score=89.61 gnl/MRDRNA2_/MRDRNA2_50062_c0_seq1:131-1915(+)
MHKFLALYCATFGRAASKLRGLEEDALCARFSGPKNCTDCVLSRTTPLAGHAESIRCQWVAPTGHCIAAYEEAASASAAFADWLSRSERLGGNWHRQSFAKPMCRAVIREVAQCEPSTWAELDIGCRTSPEYCGGCMAQKSCSFCGELEQEGVLQGIPRVRCMRAANAANGAHHDAGAMPMPCTVNCSVDTGTFELATGTNLDGAIEYPLWQQYGLLYGPGQQCKWTLPSGVRRGGGTVSGQLAVRLAKGDALHLYEATYGSSSPKVFSASSQSPVMFRNLEPPLTLEFYSDRHQESSGITFDWRFEPAAGDSISLSSPSRGRASDEPDVNDAMGDGSFWIVPTVIVVGVFMLFCCICIDYVRRKRRNREAQQEIGARMPRWHPHDTRTTAPKTPGFVPQSGSAPPKAAPKTQPNAVPKAQPSAPKSAVPKIGKTAPSASARTSQSKTEKPRSEPPQAPPPAAGKFGHSSQDQQRPKQPKTQPKAPPKASKGVGKEKPSENTVLEKPDLSQYSSDPEASAAILSIHQVMVSQMSAPLGDRKQMLREWTMRWHPDKNSEASKEMSTSVFQYINANKDWFLAAGKEQHDDDVPSRV